MSPIPQQLLIAGTLLFLSSLLMAFAMPAFANPRMGVSAHVAGLQSALTLWALGVMWQRLALPPSVQQVLQWLAVLGLFAIFTSLLLAAVWGTRNSTPIAGAADQASRPHELVVTVLLSGGSLATLAAMFLVLWGLWAWKA